MKRLTEKIKRGYYHKIYASLLDSSICTREQMINDLNNIINKLGQLEDIEKELGIDLITLFKALKNGIYVNDSVSISFYHAHELRLGYDTHYGKGNELCILKDCNYAGNTKLVSLANEGKTWALTREELEENEINND